MAISEKSLKSKFVNFWYYHKLKIPIILGAAAIITVLSVNALTTPSYDLTLVVACTQPHQLDTDNLRKALMKYTTDRNGDGAVTVLVKDVSLSQGRYMPETERAAVVQDQSIYLYLVDEESIFRLDELFAKEKQFDPDAKITDQFVDLEKEYPDCSNVKGIRFRLLGSHLQEKLGISEREAIASDFGDLSLIIRTAEHADGQKNWLSCYEESMQVLEKIILE